MWFLVGLIIVIGWLEHESDQIESARDACISNGGNWEQSVQLTGPSQIEYTWSCVFDEGDENELEAYTEFLDSSGFFYAHTGPMG